jgi:EAL domain-containing protein (putative c-di-GMP-specific phosphodiesterase class I)
MAEESNLIVELGEQMLIQACQFVQQLNHMRTVQGQSALSVHVNFSAHHFSSSSLLANLRNILDETSLNPQHLVIEITESMLIERPVESVRRMEQIKQLGVKLALDDFGTGYSALNTLCQYPLDIVKLDRSFILRLMDGKQGEVLVRAIINMAKDLELDMVAEGVETYEQLQKIKALGVSEIQGFYYYRPMPAANVFALFDCDEVAQKYH